MESCLSNSSGGRSSCAIQFKVENIPSPLANNPDPEVKIEVCDEVNSESQIKVEVEAGILGVLTSKHVNSVTQLLYHPTCDVLFCGYQDGSVFVWKNFGYTDNVEDWKIVKRLYAFDGYGMRSGGSITDMTISPDGYFLATASMDKSAYLWDLSVLNDTPVRTFTGAHEKGVLSVSISNDNRKIATSSQDQTVTLWNSKGDETETIKTFDDWVRRVRFNPGTNDNHLLALDHQNVKIWNTVNNGSDVRLVNSSAADGILFDLKYSKDGKWFAASGDSNVINIWNYEHGSKKFDFSCRSMRGPTGDDSVNCLSFRPTGKFIAAAIGGNIGIWNFEECAGLTGEKVAEVQAICKKKPRKCTSVTWSRDGELMFGAFSNGTVAVFKFLFP